MKDDRRKLDFGSGRPLVEESEIFSDLGYAKGSSLFLGRYTLNEVIAVLKKRGFLREAEKRGLGPLVFDLDSFEAPLQRFRIFHRDKSSENVIVDLKIRELEFVPRAALEIMPRLRCLAFEWLTLQNPLLSFSEERAPLPGQSRPGLNLGSKVLDIFVYLARLTGQDALLAFPAYFHNALLFSRYFRFFNPRKEGEVFAIRRAFRRVPFKQLAWAVHLDCVRTPDGRPYEWTAEEQAYPLSRPVREYFESRAYREGFRAAVREGTWTLDEAGFERKKRDLPALCGPGPGLV